MERSTAPPPSRRLHGWAVVVALALGGCTATGGAEPAREATTTAATRAPGAEHAHEKLTGSAAATERLDPQRRSALGLPPEGTAGAAPSDLPPLTPGQWADPEVVAARFVLVETNHHAADDPGELWARKAAYTSPRFAEDLRASSGGTAGRAELAMQGAVFQGEVLGLATASRDDDTTAVVDCSVRRSTAVPGGAPRSRIAFFRLILVHHDDGRWLVVDVQIS